MASLFTAQMRRMFFNALQCPNIILLLRKCEFISKVVLLVLKNFEIAIDASGIKSSKNNIKRVSMFIHKITHFLRLKTGSKTSNITPILSHLR